MTPVEVYLSTEAGFTKYQRKEGRRKIRFEVHVTGVSARKGVIRKPNVRQTFLGDSYVFLVL